MQSEGRKIKVVKNVAAQMVSAFVQTALGFVARKIFVIYLTTELLGLNGLMQSIIGMLSIAELGVGEAINYSLYKPLANKDIEQVNAIMKLYKKLYIAIASVIVALGLLFIPFLPFFLGDDVTQPMPYVYKIYALFLLDAFLSYCLAYSRNIITADQKDYIVTNADTISQIMATILQIIILLLTKNYILYLVIKIFVTFGRNAILHFLSTKMYPFIKRKSSKKLSAEYIKELKNNVKALFVTRVSYFVVSGTDNMLLSSFVSLTAVGIYSNYLIIINLINRTFNTIFDKAKAGVGNFIVTDEEDSLYSLFKNIFFINFLFTSYTSIGLFVVGNQVIRAWLGESFVWSAFIIGTLVFNNYSRYILQACECFRGAKGLYSPRPFVKYLSLLEGIINLIVSVGFVFILENDVLGIFLGTSVSTIVSTIVVPWIVYKFLFKRPLFEFYLIYFKYFIVAVATLAVSALCAEVFYVGNAFVNVIIGIAVCSVVTVIMYSIIFRKTEEFRYLISLIRGFLPEKNKA